MTDLAYSTEALNVKSAFYRAKVMLYVEGDDDVLFWTEVFKGVATGPFEVEVVGGSRIDEYIRLVEAGELFAIVGRDADLLPVLDRLSKDPRIVYTCGYSIENSMYTLDVIAGLLQALARLSVDPIGDCEVWWNAFVRDVEPLVLLDVANAVHSAGLDTIGDNCSRFMTSNASDSLCATKIASRVDECKKRLPSEALEKAKRTLEIRSLGAYDCLRGHFISSAVHRFLVARAKSKGRRVSISGDSLYAMAFTRFAFALANKHPHKEHYLRVAQNAWAAI